MEFQEQVQNHLHKKQKIKHLKELTINANVLELEAVINFLDFKIDFSKIQKYIRVLLGAEIK